MCARLVPYMSSQKGEFVFSGSAQYNSHVSNNISIRSKHFAGNFSTCVITDSEYIWQKEVKESFIKPLKVVDKPSKV